MVGTCDLTMEFMDYEQAENVPNGGIMLTLALATGTEDVVIEDDGDID